MNKRIRKKWSAEGSRRWLGTNLTSEGVIANDPVFYSRKHLARYMRQHKVLCTKYCPAVKVAGFDLKYHIRIWWANECRIKQDVFSWRIVGFDGKIRAKMHKRVLVEFTRVTKERGSVVVADCYNTRTRIKRSSHQHHKNLLIRRKELLKYL